MVYFGGAHIKITVAPHKQDVLDCTLEGGASIAALLDGGAASFANGHPPSRATSYHPAPLLRIVPGLASRRASPCIGTACWWQLNVKTMIVRASSHPPGTPLSSCGAAFDKCGAPSATMTDAVHSTDCQGAGAGAGAVCRQVDIVVVVVYDDDDDDDDVVVVGGSGGGGGGGGVWFMQCGVV